MKKKSISIFLPIRKNSKRLKNKNILRVKNYKFGLTDIKVKQLLRVQKYLKKNGFTCEFVISTDIKKIIYALKKNKNIKLHVRTKRLSTDNSLQSLINIVPNICKCEYILWTHVTSPLYNENEYINFIQKFYKIKNESAFSCSLVNKFLMNDKNEWISHDYKKIKWPKTQDLKKIYEIDSAVFISKQKNYLLMKDRLDKSPFPIVTKKYLGLDIDDEEDFKIFKKIWK